MVARRRRWLRWVIAGLVTVLVLVVAGPYLFFRFQGPAPAPLALPLSTATLQGTSNTSLAGTWTVGHGSLAGYRVQEVSLWGSDTEVGRTNAVDGTIVIAHNAVTAGSIRVDLTTVKVNGKQNAQFGKLLDTATYPDATFTLTQPIVLGPGRAVGTIFTVRATGMLAMHGITRAVSFPITARASGPLLEAAGSIPVRFSDWNVQSPNDGPLGTIQNHGAVEFLLDLRR